MNKPHTKLLLIASLLLVGAATLHLTSAQTTSDKAETPSFSLLTATPEEGFQLAITLARKGVTATQPNREILFELRDVYSRDPDALIASSQVVATHFQTISAANDYWRD